MRTRTTLLVATPLLVVSAGALWLLRRYTGGTPEKTAAPQRHDRKVPWIAGLTRPGLPKGPQVTRTLVLERVAQGGGGPAQVVRVRTDEVLAQVNGVPIGLEDLVPAGPEGERIMDPEMFRFLLDRAIDRELVLQAAAKQSVALTAEQEAQLAAARASLEQDDPGVVKQLTRTDEQVEFELRDTAGLMLQADLLAKSGASANVTTGMVQEYYQAHRSEFASLPSDPAQREAAWQKIEVEIRQRLGPETALSYQEAERSYLKELRSNADVAAASL